MEVLPGPQGSDDKFLELLNGLMGQDGLTFLDLDNAITAVKQGKPAWQAPFAVGLYALPFLYQWEKDSQGTEVLNLAALMALFLAHEIQLKSKGITVSDLVGTALEPLEAKYASLTTVVPGYGLGTEQAHTLFHIRFALGVLLLRKGDEERGTRILREMAATKIAGISPDFSSEGLMPDPDVLDTKACSAAILQDFYRRRQDYGMALYLLTEAVASGRFSESLLGVVPGLLESYAEKCERADDFGEWFEWWTDLFDRVAEITEICGEADVSDDLPSKCRADSPQFWSWRFGQLAARFAIRYRTDWDDAEELLPTGYSGEDWGNGTVVASLLCECDEHRNWQSLRHKYISMWESSARYQRISLCEAGTWTDLYWAVRIGFADKMLEFANLESLIPTQNAPSPVISDIEMTKNIVSTIAVRQMKEQSDSKEMLELLQERLPASKSEIVRQIQQRLNSVWDKLPPKVVDALVKAENYHKTGVNTDDAKVWFNKSVEASLSYCFVEPLASFTQKREDKRIAVCFPPPRGVERKTSLGIGKLFLWEWSVVFDRLSVPADKSLSSLGTEDLNRFMKEHFRELRLSALGELSRSLGDFCQQKRDGSHSHVSRYEEETQELEQMRELALGIKRPSVITQIFQLFNLR